MVPRVTSGHPERLHRTDCPYISLACIFWKLANVLSPLVKKRTFTTVADNQQTVQFPVFQGERVNCEDNTSLGEFTLAPIPPMRAGLVPLSSHL
jgi:hypothetical protein